MDFGVSGALLVAGVIGMALVRAPHIRRATKVARAASHETTRDRIFVTLVSLGLVLPLVWLFGVLSFADTAAPAWRWAAGAACLAFGLYVLHRSHADLGTNWSNTLELKTDDAFGAQWEAYAAKTRRLVPGVW